MSLRHDVKTSEYCELIASLVKYHCEIFDMQIPKDFAALVEKTTK